MIIKPVRKKDISNHKELKRLQSVSILRHITNHDPQAELMMTLKRLEEIEQCFFIWGYQEALKDARKMLKKQDN